VVRGDAVQLAAWVAAEARRRRQLNLAGDGRPVHPAGGSQHRAGPPDGRPTTPETRIAGLVPFGLRSTSSFGQAIVEVNGEVDGATAPELEEELLRLLAGSVRCVIVNLRSTTFIDSNGLAALIAALRVARDRGADILLQAPTPSVRKILQISGAAQLLRVVE
jgi:anti-sigma B factor antagonist